MFKTQQTKGFLWVLCGCYVEFIANQTAPINLNSAQGRTTGLIAQVAFPATATAPSSKKMTMLRIAIVDDVYTLNRHMITCFV